MMGHLEERRDALHEIARAAGVRARVALGRLLGTKVQLCVLRVRPVGPPGLLAAMRELGGGGEDCVTAVRQAFAVPMPGEAFVLFGPAGALGLRDLLGYGADPGAAEEGSLLLDVSNLLIGACVGSLAEALSQEASFSPPALIVQGMSAGRVLDPAAATFEQVLLVEISFGIPDRAFHCHLLIAWTEEMVALLHEHLAGSAASIHAPHA